MWTVNEWSIKAAEMARAVLDRLYANREWLTTEDIGKLEAIVTSVEGRMSSVPTLVRSDPSRAVSAILDGEQGDWKVNTSHGANNTLSENPSLSVLNGQLRVLWRESDERIRDVILSHDGKLLELQETFSDRKSNITATTALWGSSDFAAYVAIPTGNSDEFFLLPGPSIYRNFSTVCNRFVPPLASLFDFVRGDKSEVLKAPIVKLSGGSLLVVTKGELSS